MQGPCETGVTGETLDNPSMVSVLLHTKLEMSDFNKGNQGFPWASAIATLYHPPVRNEELRLSLLLAHAVRMAKGDCLVLAPRFAVSQLVPLSSHRIT